MQDSQRNGLRMQTSVPELTGYSDEPDQFLDVLPDSPHQYLTRNV